MARHVARVVGPQDTEPSEAGLSPVRAVLVAVCDSATGGAIVGALQRRGFPALQGGSVPQVLYWARRESPALVVLDARMKAWTRLAREFRQEGRQVLTLTGDPSSRAAALEAGCLDAPLNGLDPDELAAGVGILLGRGRVREAGRITAVPLVVDLSGDHLLWRGRRIDASKLLLRLAAYLAVHAGRVVSTKVLLEEVWGEPWADPNKVHQAIWRLRRLLAEPADSVFLVGRQRHGYAILPEATSIRPPRRSISRSARQALPAPTHGDKRARRSTRLGA
jgi:two-component system KDP operon response regulator KdpE